MKPVNFLVFTFGNVFLTTEATMDKRSQGKIHPEAMAKRDFSMAPNSFMYQAQSIYNDAVDKVNSATAEGAQLNPTASANAEAAIQQGKSMANDAYAQVSPVLMATGSVAESALASASSVINQGQDAAASKLIVAASYLQAGIQASPQANGATVNSKTAAVTSSRATTAEGSFASSQNLGLIGNASPATSATNSWLVASTEVYATGSSYKASAGTGVSKSSTTTSIPRVSNEAIINGLEKNLLAFSMFLSILFSIA